MIRVLLITFLFSCSLVHPDVVVMTYNIEGHPFTPHKKRSKNIGKALKGLEGTRYEPDIIAFQEAMTRKTKFIHKALRYPYKVKGPRGKGIRINSGLMIYSKFPIVRKTSKVFSDCARLDCLVRKSILHIEVTIPGIGNLDFYTTHLQASKSGGALTSRRSTGIIKMLQTDEIVDFIYQTHNPQNSLIIAGDFNYTSNADQYDNLTLLLRLKDSLDECHLLICDAPEDYAKTREGLIDHQFYKGSLRPKYFKQLWTKLSPKKLSDHPPVVVRYGITP